MTDVWEIDGRPVDHHHDEIENRFVPDDHRGPSAGWNRDDHREGESDFDDLHGCDRRGGRGCCADVRDIVAGL